MTQPIRVGMVADVSARAAAAPSVMVAACLLAVILAAAPSHAAVPVTPAAPNPAAPNPAAPNPAAPDAAPTTAAAASPASLGALTVKMQKATPSGPGDPLGTITITASDAGAMFKLKLHGLSPGPHGFHVHEDGECGPIFMNGVRIPAGAAGGHWDPDHTNKHAGPAGDGDLGDLPLIEVGSDGAAAQTLTAPRIKDIQPLQGHALVIHAGGDTYSDDPSPQGGGGLRIACGPIQ